VVTRYNKREHAVRAWCAQFAIEYQARVHPSPPDNQVLLVRKSGLSDPAYTAGVGVLGAQHLNPERKFVSYSVCLSVDAEARASEHVDGASSLKIVPCGEQTVIK
jgi:hypothetical protein